MEGEQAHHSTEVWIDLTCSHPEVSWSFSTSIAIICPRKYYSQWDNSTHPLLEQQRQNLFLPYQVHKRMLKIDTNLSCKVGNFAGSFSKFQMQRLHMNPWFKLAYLNTEVYSLFLKKNRWAGGNEKLMESWCGFFNALGYWLCKPCMFSLTTRWHPRITAHRSLAVSLA